MKVRRTTVIIIALVATGGVAHAALTVQEPVVGQKVTFDDATGYYWCWNLPDFTNMNYVEQLAAIAIAASSRYGNMLDWHMADLAEMQTLWLYSYDQLCDAFAATEDFGDPQGDHKYWIGRYNSSPPPSSPDCKYLGWLGYPGMEKMDLEYCYVADTIRFDYLGAWAVSNTMIPAPAAIVLGSIGVSLVTWLRRRRTL